MLSHKSKDHLTAENRRLQWIPKIVTSLLLSAIALCTTFTTSNKDLMPAAKASTHTHAHRVSSHINQLKSSPSSRWIEVKLNEQQILVWEGNQVVYSSVISSGTAERPTRAGTFEIQSMHVSARMRGDDYDVPDVPYTMYYSGNYALHGAYWHSNFGTPVSHGCINLPIVAADWIFSWAHVGTTVIVH